MEVAQGLRSRSRLRSHGDGEALGGAGRREENQGSGRSGNPKKRGVREEGALSGPAGPDAAAGPGSMRPEDETLGSVTRLW